VRASPFVPSDLRPRLEAARLDTLALLRAADQASIPLRKLPERELHQLYELDADCAEALWALDQPPGSLDFAAMVKDTLASLDQLPAAREFIRLHLPKDAKSKVQILENTIRTNLHPREAYDGVDSHDPHFR
jgi:hypothetical protein